MNERSITQEIGIAVVEVVVAFAIISVVSYGANRWARRRDEKDFNKSVDEESA